MVSPTKTALAKGILDAAVLELCGTQDGRLTEDSLQALEHYFADLCTKHLSLDHNAFRIIRDIVLFSKKRSLHKGKRRYSVAFSIMPPDNSLFRFTLYDGATGKGFNASEPSFKKMTADRIAFSVFFRVSPVDELKEDPAPQIIITPNKEDQHHVAYPA